ncbi:hypothetical protein LCGC14_1985730, partial [marine sediment metagenome]
LIVKGKPLSEIITKYICRKHLKLRFKDEEKFCSECGDALITKKEERWEEPYLYDILEEDKYEDLFYQVDSENEDMVWIANEVFSMSRDHILDEYELVEIDEEMIKNYVENFKTNHEEVIEVLKERVVSFEIKFGVVIYYN